MEHPEDTEQKNMLLLISDKSHIHLHQSMIELAIICFLKKAYHRNQLDKNKQGEYLVYYFIVALM